MDGRVKSANINELEQGGLTQVDTDPDIYVTDHISTKDAMVHDTTMMGYGDVGLGWGRWDRDAQAEARQDQQADR